MVDCEVVAWEVRSTSTNPAGNPYGSRPGDLSISAFISLGIRGLDMVVQPIFHLTAELKDVSVSASIETGVTARWFLRDAAVLMRKKHQRTTAGKKRADNGWNNDYDAAIPSKARIRQFGIMRIISHHLRAFVRGLRRRRKTIEVTNVCYWSTRILNGAWAASGGNAPANRLRIRAKP